MIEKLELIRERFNEVGKMIVDPDIIADMKRYVRLNKEYKDLEKIVREFEKYEDVLSNIKTNKEIISTESDPDFKMMAEDDLGELEVRKVELEESLKKLLIPKEPEDSKNCVMEIMVSLAASGSFIRLMVPVI